MRERGGWTRERGGGREIVDKREKEKRQQIIMRQLKKESEVSKGENGNRKKRERGEGNSVGEKEGEGGRETSEGREGEQREKVDVGGKESEKKAKREREKWRERECTFGDCSISMIIEFFIMAFQRMQNITHCIININFINFVFHMYNNESERELRE